MARERSRAFEIKFSDRINCSYYFGEGISCGIVNVDPIQHRELWRGRLGRVDSKCNIASAIEVSTRKLSILPFAGNRELIIKQVFPAVLSFARGNAVDPLLWRAIDVPDYHVAVV